LDNRRPSNEILEISMDGFYGGLVAGIFAGAFLGVVMMAVLSINRGESDEVDDAPEASP
jgi:hypothetical protein